MSERSLTKYLSLSSNTTKPYKYATEHAFLHAARERTLNSRALSLWLSQDRIYAAHAYPRFIGALIAKIPFSAHHGIRSVQEARNQRILALLTFSLQNVVREAGFFLQAAEKHGLDLEGWNERAPTKSYVAEMARVSSWGTLEEGLVYLDAWTFVAGGSNSEFPEDSSAGRAIDELVENWTNIEFIKFVEELREVVDDLGIEQGSDLWTRSEAMWNRTIELEADFWPELGEENL
ncbi:hypothetical protein EW145_g7430, partial [Phellinidium pouzarii]